VNCQISTVFTDLFHSRCYLQYSWPLPPSVAVAPVIAAPASALMLYSAVAVIAAPASALMLFSAVAVRAAFFDWFFGQGSKKPILKKGALKILFL
jgi:hypothetical protein